MPEVIVVVYGPAATAEEAAMAGGAFLAPALRQSANTSRLCWIKKVWSCDL